MRELLPAYGFDAQSPVIYGSALLALNGDMSQFGVPSIKLLLNSLDSHIPNPTRDYTSPFILPIDKAFTVPGRGTVVVGTLKQGTIRKNTKADLLGFDEVLETSFIDIQVKQLFNFLLNNIYIHNLLDIVKLTQINFYIRYFKRVC